MNWKSFLLGAGVGIAGGYAVRELLTQNAAVTPEKALANAKAAFMADGQISGSWIQMKPEPYQNDQLHYNVYRGGISRKEGDEIVQYEFVADKDTGTILDAKKLS